MMLNNKIDFALVFKVKNANPNGDPLGGNRPRTTSDGLGEVSDVCLKRKIRNRLQSLGKEIFVQSDELCDDGAKSLADRFAKFKASLKKEEQENNKLLSEMVCRKWMDVRSFGQVFALKATKKSNEEEGADSVSIGIRGPVTIQSAFSTEAIVPESIQITKSVNGETTKDGSKSSDTMGMKHRVSKATYVTYGSISPQLAERTGFSEEDAEAIKQALVTLFDNDESSARPSGSMQIVKVIWWKHNNKSGQYSSAKVHNTVNVSNDGEITLQNFFDLIPEIIDG